VPFSEAKPTMQAPPRFTRLLCSHTLPAWFPIQRQPDRAMLLLHLGPQHTERVAEVPGGVRTLQDLGPALGAIFIPVEEGEAPERTLFRW
jgi:hypothetical protein